MPSRAPLATARDGVEMSVNGRKVFPTCVIRMLGIPTSAGVIQWNTIDGYSKRAKCDAASALAALMGHYRGYETC